MYTDKRRNPPALAHTDGPSCLPHKLLNNSSLPKPKKEFVLEMALYSGSEGFTQPDAYKNYYESCLHTSISNLQQKHDIMFSRMPDKSTVRYQGQKPFYRYWLADQNQAKKALNLLNYYRAKRNVEPVSLSLNSFPSSSSEE